MSPRRNKPIQRDPVDLPALEHELSKSQPRRSRQERRAIQRSASAAEASGIARVTGKHYRSRPTGGAA